jgi:predicted deacylase
MKESSSPGKSFSWLPVTTLASGMELRLPVHRITGAQPGPVLGITAGIHGDEYLPLETVRQLVRQLDPAQMSGLSSQFLSSIPSPSSRRPAIHPLTC